MLLQQFINIAFTVGLSSTYGYGEHHCGDYGEPTPCIKGTITASGDTFDPELPTAAIAAPRNLKMVSTVVYMSANGGRCVAITVNDKMNERYIGKRGFDLSPGALKALGLEPKPQLLKVEKCNPKGDKND